MSSAKPKSTAQSSSARVRAFRERQRAKGLRLVQIWLPDITTPEFKAEARRQSLLVANSSHAEEDQAFIDSISDSWWKNGT